MSLERVAQQFLDSHPQFIPSEENIGAVWSWLCEHSLNFEGKLTPEVLHAAYMDLLRQGRLELTPEHSLVREGRVVTHTLREADFLARQKYAPAETDGERLLREKREEEARLAAEAERKRKLRMEIQMMTAAQYAERLKDPEFVRLVNELEQKPVEQAPRDQRRAAWISAMRAAADRQLKGKFFDY